MVLSLDMGELALEGRARLKCPAPALTVFMPAYNAEAHLGEAVESVLTQTWSDFELLVIDDGSVDSTGSLLEGFAKRDRRVRVLRHPKNRGLAATFAHGYQEARNRFVARMDADDVCEPRRLERQLAYFQRYEEVAVLGTWTRAFGAVQGVQRLPWLHDDILCEAVFQNPMAHPTVMLDRARLANLPNFRKAYQPADDYDLWSRWLRRGLRFATLPEPLLRYRLHAGQISRSGAMELGAWKVRLDWLKALKLSPTRDEATLHQSLCIGRSSATASALAWIARLEKAGLQLGLPRVAWLRRLDLFRSQGSRLQRAWLGLGQGPSAWAWEAKRAAIRFGISA